MMKRLARTCLATGCRAAALLTVAERRARDKLAILCYHRVLPIDKKTDYPIPDLVVTPESFRRHCSTLRRYYDVLPLHEAVEVLHGGRGRRRPLAAITFDDGYQDNFQYAAPILKESGIKATFFVIAHLIGTDRRPWYDKVANAALALERQGRARSVLAACKIVDDSGDCRADCAGAMLPWQVVARAKELTPVQRKEFTERLCAEAGADGSPSSDDLIMDWRQLADLADCGHEIGSHGRTHEILPQLDDAGLESEVSGSRRILEKGLGGPVRSFCYPNGEVDKRVARAVMSGGYDCAVTVESGVNGTECDVYGLRRWFIQEDRLAGPLGKTSATQLRMELCNLAQHVYRRRIRAGLP